VDEEENGKVIPVLAKAKERVERCFDCRIYGQTLPHGVDCFKDIQKQFGREFFKMIFDVGANIGQSMIKYAERFPHAEVHSFEPVAANYEKLEAAARHNPLLHAHKLGMGERAGLVDIHLNQHSTTCSIKHGDPGAGLETIELETLSGFMDKHNVGAVNFLKLDTEGYELEVLAGAAKVLDEQRIHFLFIECEPVSTGRKFVSLEALGSHMHKHGYRPFGIYEQQNEWDGTKALRYVNAVFVCGNLQQSASSAC
jgi:FkbM family methyltransferase